MRIKSKKPQSATKASRNKSMRDRPYGFYEFFAGGGMARAGLGPHWNCLFANDFDPKKGAIYSANWSDAELSIGDVAKLRTSALPESAELVWASFPCQDLSLAGGGAGLKGARSGTFWPFWSLIRKLRDEDRAPQIIALENVCGALTSHGGRDFAAIGTALTEAGYRFGAVVMDAVHFLPQSRPRLFILAVRADVTIPGELVSEFPSEPWHTNSLTKAYQALRPKTRNSWVWWNLSAPPKRNIALSDIIEDEPARVKWHTQAETRRLISMMSEVNLAKLVAAKTSGRRQVGTVYKRTRIDEEGQRRQRAEVRFDEIAGCLRTPAGGSSRQTVMIVDGKRVRSRLLSPREAARLMGLPDSYELPDKYNDAYHLAGDGVVVPVVRFLADQLIEPMLMASSRRMAKVA